MLISILVYVLIHTFIHGVVTRTITYHADISTDFYNRFVKTVYMEDMKNFEFSDHEKGRRYIVYSDSPIQFEKYRYYWNDSHSDLENVFNLCEYKINWMIDSRELYETYSQEGVQMKSLFYHCNFAQSCMGLECRIDSRLLLPPIFLTVFISIFCLFKRMLWIEMKRAERIQRVAHLMDLPESVEIESPPPSYNSVYSLVPPSYESVMLGKVTYTVSSCS